ncbi:conserved hypothetical protein [Aspergillus terreus NIH2624]|uniref:UBL3-like ubiquitin domain-containing protein n=1 Tax=Aspergillus terreus (strain NIH 2624 / FGSC A1156) TaxID=341663 RepID=Q0CF98_ASPTN|nr:uncharacterized protein ATEG_07636 [Aspergillus terreus NIH2624]EAU31898.1 conserved hypothetical protein [Aspergillus terreus NIH2624]
MAANENPPSDPSGNLSPKDDPVSTATTAAASPQEPHPQSQPLAFTSAPEPVEAADAPAPSTSESQTNTVAPTESQPPTATEGPAAPVEAKEVQQGNVDTLPTNIASSADAGEPKVEALTQHSSQSSETSAKETEDSGPSLVITLLLITGSRHPFKIDGKYLRKRSVNVENYDPFAMSVYTLKELIWREWRQDWEPRPSSPSSIRLISFGKLLDDKAPLSDSKFSRDAPNVVHMTVKPQELIDEEDAKGTKAQYTRERESSERSPGCRCVIQ